MAEAPKYKKSTMLSSFHETKSEAHGIAEVMADATHRQLGAQSPLGMMDQYLMRTLIMQYFSAPKFILFIKNGNGEQEARLLTLGGGTLKEKIVNLPHIPAKNMHLVAWCGERLFWTFAIQIFHMGHHPMPSYTDLHECRMDPKIAPITHKISKGNLVSIKYIADSNVVLGAGPDFFGLIYMKLDSGETQVIDLRLAFPPADIPDLLSVVFIEIVATDVVVVTLNVKVDAEGEENSRHKTRMIAIQISKDGAPFIVKLTEMGKSHGLWGYVRDNLIYTPEDAMKKRTWAKAYTVSYDGNGIATVVAIPRIETDEDMHRPRQVYSNCPFDHVLAIAGKGELYDLTEGKTIEKPHTPDYDWIAHTGDQQSGEYIMACREKLVDIFNIERVSGRIIAKPMGYSRYEGGVFGGIGSHPLH